MAVKELRDKYGVKNTTSLLNRAIRAECAGGNELFDALDLAAKNRRFSPEWGCIFRRLEKIRDAMRDDVARRYAFKTTLEQESQASSTAGETASETTSSGEAARETANEEADK